MSFTKSQLTVLVVTAFSGLAAYVLSVFWERIWNYAREPVNRLEERIQGIEDRAASSGEPVSRPLSKREQGDSIDTDRKIEVLTGLLDMMNDVLALVTVDASAVSSYAGHIEKCKTVVEGLLGTADLASLIAFENTVPSTPPPSMGEYYVPRWRHVDGYVRWLAMRIEQLREA